MTPLQRYIAEEIAADHADGLLNRREALRRLGLLGFGVPAAAALLAACASEQTEPPVTTQAPSAATPSTPPGMSTALMATPITFAGPGNRELQGAWAAAAQPRGGVLVVHENKGLTDHIRSVTGRFAGAGYSALAVDLLSEKGGTAAFTDPAQATAELSNTPQEQFLADLRAGLDELGRRVPGGRLGTTGFCFGGGLVWLLLASGPSPLDAATPFYGPFPDKGDLSAAKAAVLGIYAEADARVGATRPAAEAALQRTAAPHEIWVAPNADHAFFNDTGPRYAPAAAEEAWRRVLAWYAAHLG
ncbi:carboxymethylenebutenolidase [Nocardia tenerifensis]|uniref:Carboxymethylenebutenolidase n=1 Tax=Nocardia tenerifensis TaxID=228006 RepID=A0A318JLD4_9NOCA|nr:dienelactone hydrolase family protein [Nocardia tenerifensis]PXX52700.1 carboxymethylenebutenolidase [Nocardia tenerifensis]